jgi:N-acetylglucosamine kinase-like BadF-type ATPase
MYFLGIDGGGTKTEALICDEFGQIIGRGRSGPSNPLFIGKDTAFENIKLSIDIASRYYNGNMFFDSASICIPGIKRYKDEVKTQLLQNSKNTYIDSDELNAFYGALAKPFGIVVIAGTGSFTVGINKRGEKAVLGGWGPIIGDEGSGYHIGICGLKSIVMEYEGAGVKTSLTPKIMKELGLKKVPELRRLIYSKDFDRTIIANLSNLVHESAIEGDPASVNIVNTAAAHLAELVNRVVEQLKMYDGDYDAVLTGGVSNFKDLILVPFTESIERENINIKKPQYVPAIGSLMIALKESGIDVYAQDILNSLNATYKNFVL